METFAVVGFIGVVLFFAALLSGGAPRAGR
jgi:hypothetical protein